jgi:hypothetical protein
MKGKEEFLHSISQDWLDRIINVKHESQADIVQGLLTQAASNLILFSAPVFHPEHALNLHIDFFKEKYKWNAKETKKAYLMAFTKLVQLATERNLIEPT